MGRQYREIEGGDYDRDDSTGHPVNDPKTPNLFHPDDEINEAMRWVDEGYEVLVNRGVITADQAIYIGKLTATFANDNQRKKAGN